MPDRLLGLLETVDMAIGSCAGIVSADRLDPLIETAKGVRARLAYPEEVLVVALAGGTGSGKSSLFNALVGEDLVDVGGTRPTTQVAAVAVPRRMGAAMDGYLDLLDIDTRYTYPGDALCLIDLPDMDSVESGHRHRVDALLPLVDVVAWVVDPEKYRDARLHREYVEPSSGYGEQFVFVLNQADRLSEDERQAVVEDLTVAAREDGVESPRVVSTAAVPAAGPPILDELTAALSALQRSPGLLYSKLLEDLARTAGALESELGPPLDFDDRAARVVAEMTDAIVAYPEQATAAPIVDFLDETAASLTGASRAKIERVAAEAPGHIDRIVAETRPDPEPGGWFRRARPGHRDPDRVRSLVKESVVRPVRVVLAKRALAIAAVAELSVELESLGRETSR